MYDYVYNGSTLTQLTITTTINGETPVVETLYFGNGTVTYNGTVYYYATNLQGDITAILNTSGTAVVQYTYDAWGNILTTTGTLASTLGAANPLRYRGYVYDAESGLYYLQSRYYDPEMGRFINGDGLVTTGQGILGNNMFAYCNNNPISSIDSTGYSMCSQFAYTYHEYSGGYSYITDQDAPGIGNRKLGWTTVSHGGCGPVATYNALISLCSPKSFNEVLDYYNQRFFQLNAGGLAGTMPDLVAQYFRDYGYTVYMTDSPDEIDILSQSADACILWYMFPATYEPLGITVDAFGAHFVEYSKEATGYIGRNTAGNGTASFVWPSDYAYRESRYYGIGIFIYK